MSIGDTVETGEAGISILLRMWKPPWFVEPSLFSSPNKMSSILDFIDSL